MSKVQIEKILVADGNAALVAGGTALIHPTTGVFNLADGQLGIFAGPDGTVTKDTAIYPGMTKSDAPNIYIAQGNANSANPKASSGISPLPVRGFEKSQIIMSGFVKEFSGKANAAGTNCVWILGRKDGTGDEIVPVTEKKYKLTIAFHGRVVDLLNARNNPAIYPEFTAEDFTELGLATEATQRDYVVQNIVEQVNFESRVYPRNYSGAEVVALAISETGTGAGTAISGLGASGNVTIGVDEDGNNIVVNFTTEMMTSLKKVIATNGGPLDNTAEIVAYDTRSAGDGTTQADVIVFVALDADTTYWDRQKVVKTRIEVGLEEGFSALVYSAQEVAAYEGEGKGTQWQLYYESTDELRKYTTEQVPSAYAMQYATEIDITDTYYSYTIVHSIPDTATNGLFAEMPHRTHVIIPSGDTTTIAAFEAVINPWMESVGKPSVTL